MVSMEDKNIDSRRFERVFFTADDKIEGVFLLSDEKDIILEGNILNISEGGLCCIYKKDISKRVQKDERLVLDKLKGTPALDFLKDIEIEIRWNLENDFFDHFEFGCEFINMPEPAVEQIRQFVSSWEI